jgi:hypothetical protein
MGYGHQLCNFSIHLAREYGYIQLFSGGGKPMDGLYLVIVIVFFALTGLLAKLFEKV